MDRPNQRSSHIQPTVRGGGLAMVFVVAAALAWGLEARGGLSMVGLFFSFAAIAAVSFVDDIRGVSVRLRFCVQVLVSAISVFALSMVPLDIELPQFGSIAMSIIAFLWITSYINAFNFMDGINGLAAIQLVVVGVGTALVAQASGIPASHPVVIISFVAAGAALGFIPYNFPRARVFMGDVGSASMGFLLATLAVWVSRLTAWWMLLWIGLLHANFVLDTAITLVRRKLRGERLHDAHREHFYQRLVRAGWSHASVTLTEAGLQVLVVLALWQATNAAWQIKVAVGVAVIVAWLALFGFAEHVFRKSPAGVTDAEMLAARRGVQRDSDGAMR